jgi:hypothetical protein
MRAFFMISGYVAAIGIASYILGFKSDFIAALCVLIAAAALLLLIHNGVHGIIKFYRDLFGIQNAGIIICLDFITHYLPAILLGVPRNPISYMQAYLVFATYYIFMYNKLHAIYGIVSPEWTDPYLVGSGIAIFAWYLFQIQM